MRKGWNYFTLTLMYFLSLILLLNQYLIFKSDQSLYSILSYESRYTEEEEDWLKGRDTIIYGETIDALPAHSSDSTHYQGYSIDLISMLSIELGIPAKVTLLDWSQMASALDQGTIDFFNATYTRDRNEKYALSDPLFKTRGVVLVKDSGDPIKTINDLSYKKIGATSEDYIIERLKDRTPHIDIVLYNNLEECTQALLRGDLDGMGGDEQNILYYAMQYSLYGNHYILEEPAYVEDAVMVLQKDNQVFLSIINKGIKSLKKQGIIDKLQDKWNVSSLHINPSNTKYIQLIWVLFFLITIIFIILFFLMVNKDIKKLVDQKTRELRISKEKLETTFNAIPYWLVELDSHKNIVSMNKQFMADMNLSGEKILDPEDNPFRKGLYHPEIFSLIDQAISEDGYFQKEVILADKIFSLTSGRTMAGNSNQVLLMLEDVTKERLNENQIIQNSKMAAIGQLAAGFSHEIRNPLGLIRYHLYAIRKGIIKEPDEILSSVSKMEEAINSANSMVENMLNFSRIAPKEISDINLLNLIESILTLREKELENKKIETLLKCDPQVYIRANLEGMKMILINLISNAEDAMKDGGLLEITCSIEEDRKSIFIKDSGIGISQENLKNVFNPFFTTKEMGNGTGLGLYISYNQIKEYGGSIKVSSEEGKGTAFHIWFDD